MYQTKKHFSVNESEKYFSDSENEYLSYDGYDDNDYSFLNVEDNVVKKNNVGKVWGKRKFQRVYKKNFN